jgi:hypothetical protein
MANTINRMDPVVVITEIDSDWSGPKKSLNSIQFNPGAANDILVIKERDENGPIIFKTKADSASDEVIKYFHGLALEPFLDVSACTLSAGHMVILLYAY